MTEETQTQTQPEQGAETKTEENSGNQTSSVQDQVNSATEALKSGADTSQYDEAVMIAARSQKEAEDAKTRAATAEAERQAIRDKAEKVDPYTLLNDEQKQELTTLEQNGDTAAYYKRRQEMENEARQNFSSQSTQADTQARLEAAMSVHNARNPEAKPITIDTLKQDIPPSLKNDLEAKVAQGVITTDDALNAVADFLSRSKKVASTETPPASQPNLSDAPGGAKLVETGGKGQDDEMF